MFVTMNSRRGGLFQAVFERCAELHAAELGISASAGGDDDDDEGGAGSGGSGGSRTSGGAKPRAPSPALLAAVAELNHAARGMEGLLAKAGRTAELKQLQHTSKTINARMDADFRFAIASRSQ